MVAFFCPLHPPPAAAHRRRTSLRSTITHVCVYASKRSNGRLHHVNQQTSTPDDHPVLFSHPGGARVRLMARFAIGLSAVVLTTLIAAIIWRLRESGQHAVTLPLIAGASAIVVVSTLLLHETCSFALQFVTHFEIWPQSHLAVVRTAGIGLDRLQLVPWTDFPRPPPRTGAPRGGRETLWRQRLKSGRRLIFDFTPGRSMTDPSVLLSFCAEGAWPIAAARHQDTAVVSRVTQRPAATPIVQPRI